MNIYFVVAGTIGVLGSVAHAFLGHAWTIRAVDQSTLRSTQNTQDQDVRFLTWWWHNGSVVLASTSALTLLHGLGVWTFHRDLLIYLGFLWLSIFAVFAVVSLRPPVQFFKMVPGLVGIPYNVLFWLGMTQ